MASLLCPRCEAVALKAAFERGLPRAEDWVSVGYRGGFEGPRAPEPDVEVETMVPETGRGVGLLERVVSMLASIAMGVAAGVSMFMGLRTGETHVYVALLLAFMVSSAYAIWANDRERARHGYETYLGAGFLAALAVVSAVWMLCGNWWGVLTAAPPSLVIVFFVVNWFRQ